MAGQASHGGLFSCGFRQGGREKDRKREREGNGGTWQREERVADGEVIVPMKARTDLLPCPNGSADGTNHHRGINCLAFVAMSRAKKRARSLSSSFPLTFSSCEIWNGTRRDFFHGKLFSPISISSFELSFERNNRYFFFLLTVLYSALIVPSRLLGLPPFFSIYHTSATYTRSSCFVIFPLSSLTV